MLELFASLFEFLGNLGRRSAGKQRQADSRTEELSAIITIAIIVIGVPVAIILTLVLS